MITKLKQFALATFILMGGIAQAQVAGSIDPGGITDSDKQSVTLKTLRALFPDQPVAVANDLFGGMHSVATMTDLYAISTGKLQIGMLVWVNQISPGSGGAYYRYIGKSGGGTGPAAENNAAAWAKFSSGNEQQIEAGDATGTGQPKDSGAPSTGNYLLGDIYVELDGSSNTRRAWVVGNSDNWVKVEHMQNSFVELTNINNTTDLQFPGQPMAGDLHIVRNTDGAKVLSLTTYAFDGTEWIISNRIEGSAELIKYPVIISGNYNTSMRFSTAKEFRESATVFGIDLSAAATGKATVSYPKIWGDVRVFVKVGATEFELSNGCQTSGGIVSTNQAQVEIVTISGGKENITLKDVNSDDYKTITAQIGTANKFVLR